MMSSLFIRIFQAQIVNFSDDVTSSMYIILQKKFYVQTTNFEIHPKFGHFVANFGNFFFTFSEMSYNILV